jgi:hypothetical protein
MHLIAPGGPEAKIATQRRCQRTGAGRCAVKLPLAGDEPAHVFRLHRRDDDWLIAKLIEQKASCRAQSHTARLRREPANIPHMVIEATQLLVHRDRSRTALGNDGIGAQDDQQMPK